MWRCLEYAQAEEVIDDLKHYKKIDEIPFDFVRRRMSVVVRNGGNQNLLICKGAIEELLPLCSMADDNGALPEGEVPFTDDRRKQVRELTRELNEDGLAGACRRLQMDAAGGSHLHGGG